MNIITKIRIMMITNIFKTIIQSTFLSYQRYFLVENQMSSKDSNKLHYELKIVNDKIEIECFNDQTRSFIHKSWFNLIRQLFVQSQIIKISNNFVQFNQTIIYKDLKASKEFLQNRLQNIRYTLTKQVYSKCIKQQLQRIMNIRINILHKENDENIIQKAPYKHFVLATEIIELLIHPTQHQSQPQPSFDTQNINILNKPTQQIVIIEKSHHSKNYLHNRHHRHEEMMFRLSKCYLYFYYIQENQSKIEQIINHLQRYREEWLLYPVTPYLRQFSIDKIYYQEVMNKIIIKMFKEISDILENHRFQLLEKTFKLIKDDMLDRKSEEQNHFQLQEGYYLGFHVFGSTKNYHSFFNQLDQFFQSKRMWVLRPQKICCCPNIIDVEDYLKQKENIEAYLISDHIVVIIKSKQQMEELTSIKHKQKLKKEHIVSQEERLLKMLLTGVFVLDINDYDEEDLYYVYKERQGYKKFLQKQYGIKIHYTSETTKLRICLRCQIDAYRIFKGCIYSYINDMKKEKQELPQFSTPFQYYMFNNYLKPQLEKQFPDIKFASKKKRNYYRLWVRFHSKDRSFLMDRLQELRRQSERNLDYIVCKKQPICQQWFSLYRRPQTLSIQTLTCRKYIISKDTKVFVQPYQSLSRQVDEMLFLIDQSFQNCWQFTEIAQQNDINLMSLFLQFQQRKKKKPDRIKSIALTNHRYIGKMVLWYNDMLKKIENRREQDLKKLYLRYEQKTEMHIMIPRHASTNILLHFVLPSFIKEFTQQTGYSLKQIHFYYPILFDSNHNFVEDLTMKIIDLEMRKANIELYNQNFLQKESIKKIIEMDYVGLKCVFQGDQRVWKATNLVSYVFFIQREILLFKKIQSHKDSQNHVPNFKVPIFFMDASFNTQILVDLKQQAFYMAGKHIVEGPFELKSNKKYEEIFKCIDTIKNIFLSISYVVLYVDKDFNVSKNGFYYSHRQFMAEMKNFMIRNEGISRQTLNETSFDGSNVNFKKKKVQLSSNESKKVVLEKIDKQKQRQFTVFPMKIQIIKNTSKRSHNTESGRIVKRGSRRLKIQIIESQLVNWYMAQTHKDKLGELEEYLKSPHNYKNNENFLLEDISQYSILDMNQEAQKSILLDLNQISRNKQQNENLRDDSISMQSLDLSMISPVVNIFNNQQ